MAAISLRQIRRISALTALLALAHLMPIPPTLAPLYAENDRTRQIEQRWLERLRGESMPEVGGSESPLDLTTPAEPSSPPESTTTPTTPPPPPAAVAPTTAPGFFPSEEGPSFLGLIFRFLFLMAAMIGFFYAILHFMRKKSGFLAPNNELIRVVASVPLMQGRFLQIVELADTIYILGVAEGGVTLLERVEEPELRDRIRLWDSRRQNAPAELQREAGEWLRSLLGRFGTGKGGNSGSAPPTNRDSFAAMLRERGGDSPEIPNSEEERLQRLIAEQSRRLKGMRSREKK